MTIFKKSVICLLLLAAYCAAANAQQKSISARVNAPLARMTLDEKTGQLSQYSGEWEATRPVTKNKGNKPDTVKQGKVGSVLNVMGENHTRIFQDTAIQSRLRLQPNETKITQPGEVNLMTGGASNSTILEKTF